MTLTNILTQDEIIQYIKDFKLHIKFPDINIPEEIGEILNYTRAQLKMRDKQDLSLDGIQLAQYSIYLKSEINKYQAIISWCNSNIDSIIGRELPNTQGYGYIEKSTLIKRNDATAFKLCGIKTLCECKLLSIDDMDKKFQFMIGCMKSLVYNQG